MTSSEEKDKLLRKYLKFKREKKQLKHDIAYCLCCLERYEKLRKTQSELNREIQQLESEEKTND